MPNLSKSKKITKRNLLSHLEGGIQLSRKGNHKNITLTALEDLLEMYRNGEIHLSVDTQNRITAVSATSKPKKRGRPSKTEQSDVVGSVDTETSNDTVAA